MSVKKFAVLASASGIVDGSVVDTLEFEFNGEDSEQTWNTYISDISNTTIKIVDDHGSVVGGVEDVPQLEELIKVEGVKAMPKSARVALRMIDD